jgi:hypothetical protein
MIAVIFEVKSREGKQGQKPYHPSKFATTLNTYFIRFRNT